MSRHMSWLPRRRVGQAAAALALLPALALIGAAAARAPLAVRAPPESAQGYSFSVTRSGPSLAFGLHPADLLGAGGLVLVACPELGLLCTDGTGATDDVTALSYGDEFTTPELPPVEFSVAAGAAGLAGSAVAAEAGCTPAQPQADVFQSDLAGANAQDLDGDGTACASGAGFALSLAEVPSSDDVDALAGDPCSSVDLDCNGQLDGTVLLALGPGSPSLASMGATSADILAVGGTEPVIWASRTQLGLAAGDVIDALCVGENGDDSYDAGDVVMVSLAPASPSLASLGAAAGDLLQPAPLRVVWRASALGLAAADNVDALLCNSAFAAASSSIYLPLIDR